MMKLKYNEISDIKNLLWFVVFITLILLFLVLSSKNEEQEYEQIYSWYSDITAQSIITQSWTIENISKKVFKKTQEVNSEKQKYDLIIKHLKNEIKNKELTNIKYFYNPDNVEEYLTKTNKLSNISDVMSSKMFKDKNLTFNIEFYKDRSEIRWRYQNSTLKFFDVENLSNEELLWVFIHELGHYFDIKYLQKQVLFDLSDSFYDISWEDIKILKTWSDKKDFVSGYAMTNKYEDFAESFTYFVLFNDDFRQKMTKSEKLQKKYDFMQKYIFRNDEFKKTNFRIFEKNLDYYWDITKIKFSIPNFLNYLKN